MSKARQLMRIIDSFLYNNILCGFKQPYHYKFLNILVIYNIIEKINIIFFLLYLIKYEILHINNKITFYKRNINKNALYEYNNNFINLI